MLKMFMNEMTECTYEICAYFNNSSKSKEGFAKDLNDMIHNYFKNEHKSDLKRDFKELLADFKYSFVYTIEVSRSKLCFFFS